jgi:hypothetical protein
MSTFIRTLHNTIIEVQDAESNPTGTAFVKVLRPKPGFDIMCDPYNNEAEEIAYWSAEEFAESAEEVLGALFGAARSGKMSHEDAVLNEQRIRR